jgi:hypothetical protein
VIDPNPSRQAADQCQADLIRTRERIKEQRQAIAVAEQAEADLAIERAALAAKNDIGGAMAAQRAIRESEDKRIVLADLVASLQQAETDQRAAAEAAEVAHGKVWAQYLTELAQETRAEFDRVALELGVRLWCIDRAQGGAGDFTDFAPWHFEHGTDCRALEKMARAIEDSTSWAEPLVQKKRGRADGNGKSD